MAKPLKDKINTNTNTKINCLQTSKILSLSDLTERVATDVEAGAASVQSVASPKPNSPPLQILYTRWHKYILTQIHFECSMHCIECKYYTNSDTNTFWALLVAKPLILVVHVLLPLVKTKIKWLPWRYLSVFKSLNSLEVSPSPGCAECEVQLRCRNLIPSSTPHFFPQSLPCVSCTGEQPLLSAMSSITGF